jgi:hypothetical protein
VTAGHAKISVDGHGGWLCRDFVISVNNATAGTETEQGGSAGGHGAGKSACRPGLVQGCSGPRQTYLT